MKFEAAMAELEKIVGDMESAELPLDQLIESYEMGMRLVQACEEKLAVAEQKVDILTRPGGGGTMALSGPALPSISSAITHPEPKRETPRTPIHLLDGSSVTPAAKVSRPEPVKRAVREMVSAEIKPHVEPSPVAAPAPVPAPTTRLQSVATAKPSTPERVVTSYGVEKAPATSTLTAEAPARGGVWAPPVKAKAPVRDIIGTKPNPPAGSIVRGEVGAVELVRPQPAITASVAAARSAVPQTILKDPIDVNGVLARKPVTRVEAARSVPSPVPLPSAVSATPTREIVAAKPQPIVETTAPEVVVVPETSPPAPDGVASAPVAETPAFDGVGAASAPATPEPAEAHALVGGGVADMKASDHASFTPVAAPTEPPAEPPPLPATTESFASPPLMFGDAMFPDEARSPLIIEQERIIEAEAEAEAEAAPPPPLPVPAPRRGRSRVVTSSAAPAKTEPVGAGAVIGPAGDPDGHLSEDAEAEKAQTAQKPAA